LWSISSTRCSGRRAAALGDWLLRNALLALILAAIVLRYSYLQQRVASQQRSELQLRLDALRSRIRPHFLFNTLNSIASLIAVQPERAEQAIEDVAELFRAALQSDDRDSSLGEECELCGLYLDIETLRLGDRLQVEWDVDDGLRSLYLPALALAAAGGKRGVSRDCPAPGWRHGGYPRLARRAGASVSRSAIRCPSAHR
jgi:sensor histidine kinase YesM